MYGWTDGRTDWRSLVERKPVTGNAMESAARPSQFEKTHCCTLWSSANSKASVIFTNEAVPTELCQYLELMITKLFMCFGAFGRFKVENSYPN